jgi:hypothetical protein
VLTTSSAAEVASFILGQREYACAVCCTTCKGQPAHSDGTGAAVCWDCLGRVPTVSDDDVCIICNISGGPATTGRLVLQCDACQRLTCRGCFMQQPFSCKPHGKRTAAKACAHCNKVTLCVSADAGAILNTAWQLYGM